MAAAVMLLLVTVVQMNRDSVLSAITRTPPGKLSWDGSLVGSLVTYGIVPVLTAVSTAFPQVREFLFSWFMPLLRALVKT